MKAPCTHSLDSYSQVGNKTKKNINIMIKKRDHQTVEKEFQKSQFGVTKMSKIWVKHSLDFDLRNKYELKQVII